MTEENRKAELDEVKQITTKKAKITEEIVAEAKQEAEAVIEKEAEADAEEALEDVAKVYVGRAGKIGSIKVIADTKIAEVEEVHQVAQQSNERVRDDLVHDIQVVGQKGGDGDDLETVIAITLPLRSIIFSLKRRFGFGPRAVVIYSRVFRLLTANLKTGKISRVNAD